MADPVSRIQQTDDDEPPLDPAVERVRRKLARLMVGSIGVMVLGLIAVFAAIVYKISDDEADGSADTGAAAALATAQSATQPVYLPAGAKVLQTDLDGTRMLVRISLAGGGEEIIVVDLASGQVLARRALVFE